MTQIKFYWNGIRDSDGALQKARYSKGGLRNHPVGTITIYAAGLFSREVKAVFTVENDSDSMTDYFENDRIRVAPSHPLYPLVNVALAKQETHRAKLASRTSASVGSAA